MKGVWQLKVRHVYASYLRQQENGKLRVSLSLIILLPGWDIHTVLANENSFWWVDLCCGILSYDLDQHQSALGFIPVPTACLEDGYRQDRFVSISTGELRFVHIFRKDDLFCDYGIKSQQCEDYVKTWSWRDGQRVEECEMKFADFWEGTSYSSSRLPKFVPSYPTVDPCNHNLVNFYLPTGQRFDGHVICVDLPSMEIKYCGKVREGLLHGLRLEIFEFSGVWNVYELFFPPT
uniref:DUF1618 domain-containing protein n=2 Tax=Aegilops tauschii subsp. strangulata TaxID=200361 RepID=A0A453IHC4_AEGTS